MDNDSRRPFQMNFEVASFMSARNRASPHLAQPKLTRLPHFLYQEIKIIYPKEDVKD